MAKLLTKAYFDKHPLQEFSAARFAYTLLLEQDMEETIVNVIKDGGFSKESDAAILREAEALDDLPSLLRYARKSLPPEAKLLVRKKLLEHEEEALPQMQRMITSTALDSFIENSVYFFVYCKADPVPWLLANYKKIRSPYAASMMCLVLGFRADADAIPFLMTQVDSFEKNFPDDSFSQAPLLALYELLARFQTV